MGLDQKRIIKIMVLILVFSLVGVMTVEAKKLTQLQSKEEVYLHQITPQGLIKTADGFWLLDVVNKRLIKLDKASKHPAYFIPLEIENPRTLAWDGEFFWIADNEYKVIHKISPIRGQIEFTIKVPLNESAAILEGLVWDGENLWVAYSAGFSSKIMKLDSKTGEEKLSIFAGCLPRGLATDGTYLWVVSYNLGVNPGALLRFTISDDSVAMAQSKEFLYSLPGKEPTGLTFDGQNLWVTDLENSTLQKIQLPLNQ